MAPSANHLNWTYIGDSCVHTGLSIIEGHGNRYHSRYRENLGAAKYRTVQPQTVQEMEPEHGPIGMSLLANLIFVIALGFGVSGQPASIPEAGRVCYWETGTFWMEVNCWSFRSAQHDAVIKLMVQYYQG